MTTPTGTITLSNVNTELGLSSSAQISMSLSSVRGLAGVPSGAISMSNLRGKSYITFNPAPGDVYQYATMPGSVGLYFNCSTPVTWTYTFTSNHSFITNSNFSPYGLVSTSFGAFISLYSPYTLGLNYGKAEGVIVATKNGVTVGSWNYLLELIR